MGGHLLQQHLKDVVSIKENQAFQATNFKPKG
jgi:hypothetical protein